MHALTVPSASTISESSVVGGAVGRAAVQPIVLAAERRMNLFNAGGRFSKDVE